MKRLRTPRWMIAHVVILSAVAVCILAGRWQLHRLHERRAENRLIQARLVLAPVDAAAIAPGTTAASLEFRRATVTGTYDAARQVLLTGRSFQGSTGSDVLTPLRTGAGFAVLVDRGWIPRQIEDAASPLPAPPDGPVTVTGLLLPGERRGTFGPNLPSEGTLGSVPLLDLARIAKQVPYPLAPVSLRLESQTPAVASGDPAPVPLPELGEGPHFSYAVQWFLFAMVFLTGYGVLIRRSLKGSGEAEMPEHLSDRSR